MVTKTIGSNFARTDDEVLDTTNENYSQGRLVSGSSAVDVIVADTSPATTVLIDQQQITVELDHGSNTVIAPTFQLGTTASKSIVKRSNESLQLGDTGGSGYSLILKFSAALDKWVLLNPASEVTNYANLAQALAGSNAVLDFVTISERISGKGFGGGLYQVVSSDPGFNLINPAKTDSSGNFIKLILNDTSILAEQAGAVGDFDIDASLDANGDDTGVNTGTDDTAAFQECLDFATANLFDAINTRPDATTESKRAGFGGFTVSARGGANYKISSKLIHKSRVSLDLNGGGLIADNSATWETLTGPVVDWITVTGGGTNYTQGTVSVALSGGGFTSAATAIALVAGGSVVAIFVTDEGDGYTSAPAITINDSGSGSGATATSELMTLTEPLVENRADDNSFAAFRGGLLNGSLWCRGIADGYHMYSSKSTSTEAIDVFDSKTASYALLGCDRNTFQDCNGFGGSKYLIYGSYNWEFLLGTTSNENEWYGGAMLGGSRSSVRLGTYSNSWKFANTVRQSVDGETFGHEFVIGAGTTGHALLNTKIEHDGGNPNASIVVVGGGGHDLVFNVAPNTPTVFYKWVQNVGGNDVRVKMIAARTVMDSRIVNPNSANDFSPFLSLQFDGITVNDVPYSTLSDLSSYFDWCRDLDGDDQASTSQFNGWMTKQGLLGTGSLSGPIEAEVNGNAVLGLQTYVKGSSVAGFSASGQGNVVMRDFVSRKGNIFQLQAFANDAAATGGGLVSGDLYEVAASDPRQVAIVI